MSSKGRRMGGWEGEGKGVGLPTEALCGLFRCLLVTARVNCLSSF